MSVPEPTIQIVDDDELFLAAISQLLRASGFAVKTFSPCAMPTLRAVSWPICRCHE